MGFIKRMMGFDSGARKSSEYLSPKNPQTGDGRTTRSPYDKVNVVFRNPDGTKRSRK
jgi:hypothetical protein